MSHAKNKVNWCLKKAEKDLKETERHRGLVKIKPDLNKAREYIKKAEHNLKAAIYFFETEYSDWSASAFFYAIYHSFLAIATKFGYESENQECTFALIYYLLEEDKIDFDKELLDKVATLDSNENKDKIGIKEREFYQYGTKTSIEKETYERLLELTKEVLSNTKEIIEK